MSLFESAYTIPVEEITLVPREIYLSKLRPLIDKPLIKVLTGMRRSGKSSLLTLLQREFLERGIAPERIVSINFENLDYSHLDTAGALHTYITDKIDGLSEPGKTYILLDEVQEVQDWERAVNSLFSSTDIDIYITGSNSHLLSSELATYLAGRYVQIEVHTLTFREYLLFQEYRSGNRPQNVREALQRYIRTGGFPVIHVAEYELETAYRIIRDIYSSAVLKDVVERYAIRNIEMLERIVKFVFDNVGNTFSAKRVSDYFKSQQRRIDLNTVYNYLDALESAFVIHRVNRHDLQGRAILKTNEKYFLGDPALLFSIAGFKDHRISGVLENIVFLELRVRGYDVTVGKLGDREIDFVAARGAERIYVQVAYRMNDSEGILEREFGPLLRIRDHHPKYVVTMDDFFQENIKGVRHVHLADFLVMESYQ